MRKKTWTEFLSAYHVEHIDVAIDILNVILFSNKVEKETDVLQAMKDHVHNYRIAAGNRMVVDKKTGEVVKREFHGKDCKGDSKIKDAGTRDQEEQVVQYKGFVIGKCPKCTSDMTGFPYPGCEVKKTGRYFYKECTACTYYVEIFKRGNKFTEMEGG